MLQLEVSLFSGGGSDMAAQEGQQTRTPHRATGRSAPESDKDSGFSDVASECLSSVDQTDTEEAPPPSLQSTSTQKPLGARQPHPPPLLILKNLLVDQGPASDPCPRSWAVRPSFQLLPSSSQILVFPQSAASPSRPPPPREKPTNYLPILNSYPKIAPHPSQPQQPAAARGNKRRAESWRQNQTKKPQHSSTAQEVPAIVGEISGPEEGLLNELLTCPEQTDSIDQSGSKARAGTSIDSSDNTHLSATPQQLNKSRRFQNTLDVLHRSGLLSIAMKTKELTRLNQATQCQLERLQAQVSAYTRALSTNRPEDWHTLQELLLVEGDGTIAM